MTNEANTSATSLIQGCGKICDENSLDRNKNTWSSRSNIVLTWLDRFKNQNKLEQQPKKTLIFVLAGCQYLRLTTSIACLCSQFESRALLHNQHLLLSSWD